VTTPHDRFVPEGDIPASSAMSARAIGALIYLNIHAQLACTLMASSGVQKRCVTFAVWLRTLF
jgi:hypothetical protein